MDHTIQTSALISSSCVNEPTIALAKLERIARARAIMIAQFGPTVLVNTERGGAQNLPPPRSHERYPRAEHAQLE